MRPRADTLLVWTGAPCSSGCAACPIAADSAPAGIQVAELLAGLAGGTADAGRLAVLVGGEPFLRPDLPRLLAAIRAAGYAPGLVTTGRALAYPRVRETLRRIGLTYLRLQLFGLGETHDDATGVPGGFEQALAGLRAWLAEAGGRCDVDVALSTRGRSAAALAAEIDGLARALSTTDAQIVVALDPDAPPTGEAREALRGAVTALAGWNDDATRPLLVWEGLPDLDVPAAPVRLAPPRPRFLAAAPRACCLGSGRGLARQSAAGGETIRANSFNFVRQTTAVPWTAAAADCTAYSAAAGRAPYRHLWLVEDGALILHDTDTGDFSDAEIERVKHVHGHVFLDRAAAGVLDDFTEGMRRVLPDPICETCAHRTTCGRRFQVVEGPPFAREEAWIANYVAGLRGCVLDVGCGEQLYLSRLTPLVHSGAVQYTGLDPDRLSLARLQTALPQARLHVGGIEDFHGEPASYDCILCLRSLNHVADVDEALARMAGLLRPSGQLLIVETTPFAMLRRQEQVAAADQAPRAGHQHFRNVFSEEVVPLARRRGLRIVEHHPAGLHTSNEWILLLEPAGRSPA